MLIEGVADHIDYMTILLSAALVLLESSIRSM